jgi:ABC-type transporter Mla MlaB component
LLVRQFQYDFNRLNSVANAGLEWDRTMAVEPTESKTIVVAGPLTLYEVSVVRDSLRMALADADNLRIDLSESGPWDLAGIQLLVACVNTARGREQEVRLVNVPKIGSEIAERAGLAGWLRSVKE